MDYVLVLSGGVAASELLASLLVDEDMDVPVGAAAAPHGGGGAGGAGHAGGGGGDSGDGGAGGGEAPKKGPPRAAVTMLEALAAMRAATSVMRGSQPQGARS